MSAAGQTADQRPAATQALIAAARHYVNCPDDEAQTGDPYYELVEAVRNYERTSR